MKDGVVKSLSYIATGAAMIFSMLYIYAAWTLYQDLAVLNTGDGKNWDHAWNIFVGIQSAGLSAIGVLLGVAVQQPRVADAKDQASKAKGAIEEVLKADKNSNDADGGVSHLNDTKLTDSMRKVLVTGLGA